MRRPAVLALAALLATVLAPAPAAADPEVHRIYRIPDPVADVALDAAGNVYLASYAGTPSRSLDAMVIKLNAFGDVEWSRTFGGSDYDVASGIAVDSAGDIHVVGTTRSADFDRAAGAWRPALRGNMDAFAAKLDSGGNVRWASYLGGSGDDHALDVDWGPGGQLVAAGETWSCDFPTTSGAYDRTRAGCPASEIDAFVVKLSADGRSAVFSTHLGGTSQEQLAGVAVSHGSGSVMVAGMTASPDYPTTAGAYDRTYNGAGDAFVSKLSADGRSLTHSTFLGGSGVDQPNGFVRGIGGQPILAGETTSPDLPTTSGAFQTRFGGGKMCSHWEGGRDPYWVEEVCPDAFAAQLRADFAGREFVTYAGTAHYDAARDLGIDGSGNVYLTGDTNSTAFPEVDDRTSDAGARGLFALALTPDGKAAMYSQRMGGTANDAGDEIGVTSRGLAWIVGRSYSTDWAFSGSGGTVVVNVGMPSAGLVITPRSQSEWWVEAFVGGKDANIVAKVEAADEDSPWTTLAKQPWGFYAGPLHVEPGHAVKYRATTIDGRVFHYPPPETSPFHADFQNVKGNEWWIQARVVANDFLAGVDARIDGGSWKPLTLRSWGDWAASHHAPEGSIVQLRARSQDGDVHESPCYRWTSAAIVNCPGTSWPPEDTFRATFTNVRGNEWWVETDVGTVGGTLAGVDARVNGGTWVPLEKKSYGSWAKSIHAPAGSMVEFRARSTDGQEQVSAAYRWPPG